VCGQFLPIKIVEYTRSHSYVHHELVPWLSVNLLQETRAISTLRVCFKENFNNIRDHSAMDVGCSAARYDQAAGIITICISDFGVGIPAKVRKLHPEVVSDQAAIALACKEGFTTQSTPRNMGCGLTRPGAKRCRDEPGRGHHKLGRGNLHLRCRR
jgi:hypothetical protein